MFISGYSTDGLDSIQGIVCKQDPEFEQWCFANDTLPCPADKIVEGPDPCAW